ncbi:MAG: hypothetical protein HN950_02015 [Chloroflexi bacterium]|nr:hypothetical protein [Chloroflexota bacterium]
MNDLIIDNFGSVYSSIIGFLLVIGLAISPKRRPTKDEVISDLNSKLKRQRGMTINAQAGNANLSAALDTQEKKYRREFHLQELKHKQEMDSERRKRKPL